MSVSRPGDVSAWHTCVECGGQLLQRACLRGGTSMYWLASRCVCARLLTPLFGRQLDRDCKGVIGFKEYLQGVHVLQRGSRQDLLKFLFAGARVTTPASPPCCSLTFVFICCVCVRLAQLCSA